MRVLHVLASRGAGGAEVLVRDLAIELTAQGVKAAVAFISRARDLGASEEFERRYQQTLDRASIETFDIGHECRRNPVLGSLRLRRIVARFRPDVLHVHLQHGLVYRALMPSRVPTVYTHHIDRFRRGKGIFQLISLRVDHFVAISAQTEKLLRNAVRSPVSLILNAVKFEQSAADRKRSKDPGRFEVLSVGGMTAQKNYPRLVRVAAKLLEKGVAPERIRFRIAGDGPERQKIEDQIASSGLIEMICPLGTRNDVHQLMMQSDLLLMTSDYEGLPITLIEAAHAGLPVVATNVGGCAEVVEHGQSGFLAPPTDEDALADYVLRLMSDSKLRARFANAARKRAGPFSIRSSGEKHLALYRQLTLERKAVVL